MEFIREILSKNLEGLRKSKGLKRKELAEKANVAYSGYVRWENGLNWPDPESLEKIALFYNVKSSRFFYDSELDLSASPPVRKVTFNDKINQLDTPTREHLEALIDGLLTARK